MLRSGLLLALGLSLADECHALVGSASSLIKYRTYAEMAEYLLELNATFPDVVRVSVAQETYKLPYPEELQCIVDEKTNATELCKQFVVHLTNHSTLASDPERPQVFFSGAVHGNERVGPNAVIELVALFAHATSIYQTDDTMKPTADTQRWLRELVNTRNVLLVPMTNAYGYSHNRREELTVDPNRDYNYMRAGTECMQTMTSRVVNEIWRDHMFQLAVTFHGGTRAIAYEWGSPDHYSHGDKTKPSERSPDDMAQVQLGNTLASYAGKFPDGELYPTGTMNDVVYGVTGGMEDWGYAASWENQFYDEKSHPFLPCEPTTFGGYPKKKTVYNNVTNRAFNVLVETSNSKEPLPADMGDFKELYSANVDFFRTEGTATKIVGHVPRNVRLALMMIEMVQPLVRWVSAERSPVPHTPRHLPSGKLVYDKRRSSDEDGLCSPSMGAQASRDVYYYRLQRDQNRTFEAAGCLGETKAQKGTTRRFYEFASNTSEAAAANTADKMDTSLFVACLDLGNVTSDTFYVRAVAIVDQNWKKQGAGGDKPSPQVPPQSHLVNARTNADWTAEWNGHKVKASLEWVSPIITVDVTNRSKTKRHSSNAKADGSPAQKSSFAFQSAPSQDVIVEADNSVDTPTAGKIRAGRSPDEDDGESSSGDSEADVNDGSTLDHEEKTSSAIEDAPASSSSSDITQDATALSATSLKMDTKNTPSSLLQYGYVILCSCAVIVVLTLVYLYRRVFQRARQPYMNINNLESTIGSSTEDDHEVDGSESTHSGGPRIPRHAQSSQSVME
uniref:Peptidase M14 domain-containing protein n=1 Tax=Peronospora matthiolae TaxID=2874970 RepID=A0AAV1UGV7_9STRA